MFAYIEMAYNSKRKHVRAGVLSPVEFKKRQKNQRRVVYETRAINKIATIVGFLMPTRHS